MAPKGALVQHPKEPLPPWGNFADPFQRCKDIVLSLGSTTLVILDISSALA